MCYFGRGWRRDNGEASAVSGFGDVTTYYLLHRHDFGMEDAPVGAYILYAISCWLSDHDLGYDGDGRPAPLVDQVHRLMHPWRAGDVVRVNEYLDARGLRRDALFHQLLQALIELADAGREERSLLENTSNQIFAKPVTAEERQAAIFKGKDAEGYGQGRQPR